MASNQFDQELLELVNIERAKVGAAPLELDSQLDQAANLHNDEMVRADEMNHQVAGEAGLGDRVTTSGYQWNNVAENVAAGSTTPEEVMYGDRDGINDENEGWINSPGHRANILNPDFTDIGIGYEDAPDNRPYENGNTDGQDYDTYWTQVFGAGDNNDSALQYQSADEVDEPEPTPQQQPVDEVDEPEPTPQQQPVDEVDEPEPTPQQQPVDEVDEPEPTPEGQPVDEGDSFDETILDLFNAERAAAGLDLLEIDSQLDQAANLHTNEMVQADRLSHQLSGEADLGDRVSATGYEWRELGETVAGGFEDPEALVDGLMNSSANREMIFNPDYTHLGVGYEEAADNIADDIDVYQTIVFGVDASGMG